MLVGTHHFIPLSHYSHYSILLMGRDHHVSECVSFSKSWQNSHQVFPTLTQATIFLFSTQENALWIKSMWLLIPLHYLHWFQPLSCEQSITCVADAESHRKEKHQCARSTFQQYLSSCGWDLCCCTWLMLSVLCIAHFVNVQHHETIHIPRVWQVPSMPIYNSDTKVSLSKFCEKPDILNIKYASHKRKKKVQLMHMLTDAGICFISQEFLKQLPTW
jgi:hypothetical protein